MPVELTSFSARYIDRSVQLNWNTATELNNFGFAIERSQDSENWEEVGFVPGYGTSSSPKSYAHIDYLNDELAYAPQLAYRLRQMDRDGTTDYSNIVYVKTGELPAGVALYTAYPNPFNPATTISFTMQESANVNLKVYNTFGQEVATLLRNSAMDAGLHTVAFNGDKLPSGVYLAVLEANGVLQQQKLVLNK
ncbi:MAG: T9SS type A sorting domain-containing protein [Bacteroidota bacterium]